MARQVGLLKLVGTLGDISFYKAVYGYLARAKTGVDRKTILTDPRFQRTRENASEFGRGAKAGKLVRVAIRPLLQNAKDGMTVQRLTQKMVKVLQADTINRRGLRTVTQGDLSLLNGFDFNIHAKLDNIIQTGIEVGFDRVAGVASLHLNTYLPKSGIKAPDGATHYKVSLGVAALDFNELHFLFSMATSEMFAYNNTPIPATTLTAYIAPGLPRPVIIVVGIAFFQLVNGKNYALKDKEFNALGVVEVFE